MPKKALAKDENPQFLNFRVLESAANTWTTAEILTPIFRQLANGNALVMEILKIFWVNNNDGMGSTEVEAFLMTAEEAAEPAYDENTVLDKFHQQCDLTTSGKTSIDKIVCHEFDDGAGHGLLVGNSKLYAGVVGTGQSSAMKIEGKILYRLKEVSAGELLGILQD